MCLMWRNVFVRSITPSFLTKMSRRCMITSLQQKKKILEKLTRLQAQLDAPTKPGVPEILATMSNAQIEDAISLLRADVYAYDAACEANLDRLEFDSYEELYKLPIVIRLASNLTLEDFSKATGISESQIKLYESNDYQNAPSHIFSTILKVFNIQLNGYAHRSM
ncbi:helix-turn-helix transcriptional regulator [Ketobacter sp. MCCC 1A13808]|nr:helix-turn-helix transcriptional regulator [Ketobacter sp. MCCC 1A13808]